MYQCSTTAMLQDIWQAGQEVIAVYDFRASSKEDLPFVKGDVLTIVRATKVPVGGCHKPAWLKSPQLPCLVIWS